MQLSTMLKNKRLEKGISVEKFAMDMSINKINLYKIEASKNLSEKTVNRYLFALGTTMEEVFQTPVTEPDTEALLYKRLYNPDPSYDLGIASINRRMGRNRALGFHAISKITGIPEHEMINIEEGLWNGRVDHLLMYFRYIGCELTPTYKWMDEQFGIERKDIEKYKMEFPDPETNRK